MSISYSSDTFICIYFNINYNYFAAFVLNTGNYPSKVIPSAWNILWTGCRLMIIFIQETTELADKMVLLFIRKGLHFTNSVKKNYNSDDACVVLSDLAVWWQHWVGSVLPCRPHLQESLPLRHWQHHNRCASGSAGTCEPWCTTAPVIFYLL